MEALTTRKVSELVHIPERLATGLTKQENQIFELTIPSESNPKIKDHPDLLALAGLIISTATVRLGTKPKEGDDADAFVQIIESDLYDFPELTKNEILTALKMGLSGEFNSSESIFFSSSQFVRWIKAFIEKQKRPVGTKVLQLMHQLPDHSPEPTKEEHRKEAIAILNRYIAQRIENPDRRVDCAAGLYTNLVKFEIIELPIEQRQEIYAEQLRIHKRVKKTQEEIISICQTIAYNRIIRQLADLGQCFDPDGKLIRYEKNK